VIDKRITSFAWVATKVINHLLSK